jgi:hypothetical protein
MNKGGSETRTTVDPEVVNYNMGEPRYVGRLWGCSTGAFVLLVRAQ